MQTLHTSFSDVLYSLIIRCLDTGQWQKEVGKWVPKKGGRFVGLCATSAYLLTFVCHIRSGAQFRCVVPFKWRRCSSFFSSTSIFAALHSLLFLFPSSINISSSLLSVFQHSFIQYQYAFKIRKNHPSNFLQITKPFPPRTTRCTSCCCLNKVFSNHLVGPNAVWPG